MRKLFYFVMRKTKLDVGKDSDRNSACREHKKTQNLPLLRPTSYPHASHLLRTTHLGPGPCPPLGWAGHTETGPPGFWTVTKAGFGRHGLVGAVGEGQQALYSPGLHPQFPATPAAGTPLLCHPPGHRAKDRRRWD
jgi:hypothetical protein